LDKFQKKKINQALAKLEEKNKKIKKKIKKHKKSESQTF
jgi:hypothetical protein